ncbi:hypothetical protein [Ectobacillus polymachus]|uniref:hypothetical protein n=1 Tax=Ectobacillus polymachus TaxID=1508806 RepID=UPI003A85E023
MITPIIDNVATLGETLLLVDITKRFKTKENKETGKFEKTTEFSYVYTVVCLERKFDKFDVKIDENTPLFTVGENNGKAIEIPENCFVEFENLTIRPYVRDNWIQLSATAKKCRVVDEE